MSDPAREQLPGWAWVTITGLAALVLPIWALITAATVQITPELAGFDDVIETGVELGSDLPVWWAWAVGAARALAMLAVVLPVAAALTLGGWGVGRALERRRLADRVARDGEVSADAVLEGVEVVVHREASWDPRADDPALGLPLAPPSRRILAALIDSLLLLAVYPVLPVLALLPFADLQAPEPVAPALGFGVAAASLAAVVALVAVQWSGLARTGQTLGKRWLRVRVVRPDGSPAGFLRAVVLRAWAFRAGCALVPVLGWWLAPLADLLYLLSEDRRTLHDLLADTIVVDA